MEIFELLAGLFEGVLGLLDVGSLVVDLITGVADLFFSEDTRRRR